MSNDANRRCREWVRIGFLKTKLYGEVLVFARIKLLKVENHKKNAWLGLTTVGVCLLTQKCRTCRGRIGRRGFRPPPWPSGKPYSAAEPWT